MLIRTLFRHLHSIVIRIGSSMLVAASKSADLRVELPLLMILYLAVNRAYYSIGTGTRYQSLA